MLKFFDTMMPGLLRDSLFILLRYSGIPFLVRVSLQRRRITILVYHALSESRARDHFRALRARYHIIVLADYLRARSEGTLQRLPSKALIITFDDGHRNNFELRELLGRAALSHYNLPLQRHSGYVSPLLVVSHSLRRRN